MKVIIAGSRYGVNQKFFEETLHKIFLADDAPHKITQVISGCADGVDTMAIQWAQKHGIDIVKFHANWRELGPKAGPLRNADMAEYGDLLVAFFNADAENRGTKNMCSQMVIRNKPLIRVSEAHYLKRDRQLSLFPSEEPPAA